MNLVVSCTGLGFGASARLLLRAAALLRPIVTVFSSSVEEVLAAGTRIRKLVRIEAVSASYKNWRKLGILEEGDDEVLECRGDSLATGPMFGWSFRKELRAMRRVSKVPLRGCSSPHYSVKLIESMGLNGWLFSGSINTMRDI